MKKYFQYFRYLIRHKFFVGVACCRTGLYREALTHDLSKFMPDELIPYSTYFYGKGIGIKTGRDKSGYYKAGFTGDLAFDFSWLLHQKRNDHHWQWWVLPEDSGAVKILPMPRRVVLHMLCDWWGAGRAQGSTLSVLEWFEMNSGKMQLHAATVCEIREMILQHEEFRTRRNA